MTDYKQMYENLRDQFDTFLKHKKRCPQKCKDCKQWYNETVEYTNRIKNKELRENMLELWDTLLVNGETNFDVIANTFTVPKRMLNDDKKR